MDGKPRNPTSWLTFASIAMSAAYCGVKILQDQDHQPIVAFYAHVALAGLALALLAWIGRIVSREQE